MMKLTVCLDLADSSLIKKRVIIYDKILFYQTLTLTVPDPIWQIGDQH